MHDALITELSKIGALKVISRTSAMYYKEGDKPLPQVARKLNVDAVIEGSVLREGKHVRIMVQLIHGSTDRHLWAQSFDRELTGVLALHDVAQAIASEIKVRVTRNAEDRPSVYSARSIKAGSIRTAWTIGRSAASNAPARIASDGVARICRSVAFT